jgi:hypothetical protein
MMNKLDRAFVPSPEAEVRYLHSEFKIVRGGSYVRCAVTGQPIPLDDLKYWSVEQQEAYVGPEAALERLRQLKAPSVYGR